MQRAVLTLNLLLAAAFGVLWMLDALLERRFERERQVLGEHLTLPSQGAASPAGVARAELTLPGSSVQWIYERRKEGWRIPQYRDAFALGQELDGIVKALLESRGTIVGRVPADAAHFGLEPAEAALRAELSGASGKRLLRGRVGLVAPGQRSGESFMTADGSDFILLMNANPWSYIQWRPGAPFPPLTDARVIPLALGRRSMVKITLGGPKAGAAAELTRREVAQDPRQAPDRGPRFEWYGKVGGPEEKHLNDRAAFDYARSLSELSFDELLGTRSKLPAGFDAPPLTVTLQFEGDATDTLTLGSPAEKGLHRLHNSATDQVLLIAPEKAAALVPDAKALLEPPPEKPAPAQAGPSPLPLKPPQEK